MTYNECIRLGSSAKEADMIAHYASTYSDHPTHGVLIKDNISQGNFLGNSKTEYRFGIDYRPRAASQDENFSMWHSMMSNQEAEKGMTEDQATRRGLEYGWKNVFESASKSGTEKWQYLGPGLHALQDSYAHGGEKNSDHLGFNWCIVGDGYAFHSEAAGITRSAFIVLDVLNNKTTNLKDGEKINLNGMSGEQLQQFLTKLMNLGFTGKITNSN